MRNSPKRTNRLGEKRIMNCGEEAEIIKYNGCGDIIIEFINTKEKINCQYREFKSGELKSHFSPTVCGIGIVGLEKTRESGKNIDSYYSWKRMLQRCYSEKFHKRQPTYRDCTVCNEWKYYPNFKKWYDKNYYTIDSEIIELDKDIMYKGNKIYSPDTCVFVPSRINCLFEKSNRKRGACPIGVTYIEKYNKFMSSCNNKLIKKSASTLGLFDTPELAFNSYKWYKENHIKEMADIYKDKIPDKLYNAMYSYIVEITD